jgi:DNA-binding NarL/FixJ family response regulator
MILTLHEDRSYIKQALDAGVRGYVLKRAAAESLVGAIRAVMVGGLYIDPVVAGRVFDHAPAPEGRFEAGRLPDLTTREAEVLKLSALGYTGKEIARQMALGVKSVETYKARGMEKLDLAGRADLVRYAAAQGWLSSI